MYRVQRGILGIKVWKKNPNPGVCSGGKMGNILQGNGTGGKKMGWIEGKMGWV